MAKKHKTRAKINRLYRRVRELEAVCGETYQVIGSLLSDVGLFGTERGDKVLDNLYEGRLVHQDVLPWDRATQRGL